jgi:ribosomal protein S20
VANIKSQIKRNRQTLKRQARNKSVRSELRTRTKRAVSAIEGGAEDADEALRPRASSTRTRRPTASPAS